MVDSYSPQPCAVGEDVKNTTENRSSIGIKPTYASLLAGKQSADSSLKLELCPVSIENGTPCVEFTVDEVNSFTREEGLHQAIVIKFSYEKPALHELRQILPKQFDVKGICNIGQLEFRHILVRFDLFEDFAHVVSKTSGYIQSKGDDFFFRTFPWTMGFNPLEETSKAVVWISFPDLPANFFARKSLMSIASAVGKPLSVDKATEDRTRPSTARVKVLIDLLDKLPKKIKIKILDIKFGKIVEYDQQIVFDNFPKYCTFCNHQGHDVKACHWNTEDLNPKTVHVSESEGRDRLVKSGRDIREFLNEKKASRDESALQNVTAPNDKVGVSLPSISADSIELCKKLSFGTLKVPMDVITENEITLVNEQQRLQDSVALKTDAIGASVDHISGNNLASSSEQQSKAGSQSGGEAGNKFDHNLVEEINPVSTGIVSKSFGSVPEANLYTNGQIDATDEQNAGLKEDVITSVSAVLHSAMQNTVNLVANANTAEQCVNDSVTKVAPQSEGVNDTVVISNTTASDPIDSAANEKADFDKVPDSRGCISGRDAREILNDISSRRGKEVLNDENADAVSPVANANTGVTLSAPVKLCIEPTAAKQQSLNVFTEKNIAVSRPDQHVKQLQQCDDDSETKVAPQSEGVNDTVVISNSNASDPIDSAAEGHEGYTAGNVRNDMEKSNQNMNREQIMPILSGDTTKVTDSEYSIPIHPAEMDAANMIDSSEQNKQNFDVDTSNADEDVSNQTPAAVAHSILNLDTAQLYVNSVASSLNMHKHLVSAKGAGLSSDSDPSSPAAKAQSTASEDITKLVSNLSDADQNIGSARHVPSAEMPIAADENLDHNPNRSEELNTSPAQLGTAADSGCNNAVPKATSDGESSDNQQQGTWLSRDKKAVRSKSKKKQNSAENNPVLPSTNSFDLVNVKEDEGKNVEESRQICHSQNSSHNSEAKNKKQAKIQTSLTIATAKPKLWKDQRDYDDDETWGEGLASISWEEEECATSEDSDDSVEQKAQRKNTSKNSRATSRHNPIPNTILNHNAPVFIPRNKAEAGSLDGQLVKTGEGVNIRSPMRNAKKQQTAQLIPSNSNRSKNKI